MADEPVKPIVGDVWASKRRRGYTVEVLKVRWRRYGFKPVHEVEYRTKTTPAKKASTMSTVVEMADFLKAFKKTYPGLEEL